MQAALAPHMENTEMHIRTGEEDALVPTDSHCSNFPKEKYFFFFFHFVLNLKTGRHLHGYNSLTVIYIKPFCANPFKHWKHL